MVDFIITIFLDPPAINLEIKKQGKRVALILNPDTSQDDIDLGWSYIKKKQAEWWPKYKKINISPTKINNLIIGIEDMLERMTKKNHLDTAIERKYKIKDLDRVAGLWESGDDSLAADKKRAARLRKIRSRLKHREM